MNKYKENFVVLQLIGISVIKVEKQGQLSTPTDVLVNNFNPSNLANRLN